MRIEKISFLYNGERITLNALSYNLIERAVGLMFKSRENAKALLFKFGKEVREPIHSIFVFFPFLVLWLDHNNNIIDLKLVRPFELFIRPKKTFYKILEIPVNKNYRREIKLLVGNQKV